MTKKMHLAAFVTPAGAYTDAWRLAEAVPGMAVDIEHYVHAAKVAEQGKMDCVIFDDVVGVPHSDTLGTGSATAEKEAEALRLEAMQSLPAIAMHTRNIGLIATVSTNFNHPYQVSRRIGSIDHICDGRAGMNLDTAQLEDEARNYGLGTDVEDDELYARAAEFCDVCAGLWDSWDKGGVVREADTGRYFDASKVHVLGHDGRFFIVRGPLSLERCPQGQPVVAHKSTSKASIDFAGRYSDVAYTTADTIEAAKASYAALKAAAVENGRDAGDIVVMPAIIPIVGRTDEDAETLHQRIKALGSSTPDCLIAVGSPETVADLMESWFSNAAADGFTVMFPFFPGGIDDFVGLVIPELQKRDLFRTDYEGGMLRDLLGVTIPESRYQATA